MTAPAFLVIAERGFPNGGLDVDAMVYGLAVGALSVYWTLFEDPSVGGLSERLAYFDHLMHTDRVAIAFVVDIALVYVWQAYFMKSLDKECGALANIPYWGLCIWLLL